MRYKDYEQQPSPGSFRIAMLGASTVMGWGAGDGETFEALLETRLNRERVGGPYARYEILNFGVPGYQPPQQLVALEKALRFHPNAVFYVAAGREVSRAAEYLAEVVRKQVPIPYPPLVEIVRKAGLTPTEDETTALRQLNPHRAEVLSATYGLIAGRVRSAGAVPVFVFLPQVRGGSWQEETPETLRIAGAAGFILIDLSEVFAGQDLEAIRLAEWDDHPNAKGHQLVAQQLYAAIASRPEIIPPPTSDSTQR